MPVYRFGLDLMEVLAASVFLRPIVVPYNHMRPALICVIPGQRSGGMHWVCFQKIELSCPSFDIGTFTPLGVDFHRSPTVPETTVQQRTSVIPYPLPARGR